MVYFRDGHDLRLFLILIFLHQPPNDKTKKLIETADNNNYYFDEIERVLSSFLSQMITNPHDVIFPFVNSWFVVFSWM